MEVNAEGLLLTISETPGEGGSGGVSVGMSVAEMTLTTTAASDAVREGSSAASCAPGGTSVLPGRKRGAGAAPAAGSVEHYAAEVAAAHGFSVVSHTIELFGTCAECRGR